MRIQTSQFHNKQGYFVRFDNKLSEIDFIQPILSPYPWQDTC